MQQTSVYQSGYTQPMSSQVKYHQGRTDDDVEIVDEVGKIRDDRNVRTSANQDQRLAGSSAQKYVVPTTNSAIMQPAQARNMEMAAPQSPHNGLPAIQQERHSPIEKSLAMGQYSQPNTQVQTQTNLLPAYLLQQQQLLGNKDGRNLLVPDQHIPLDQYGYPEGYKFERDMTLLIREDKARLKERFFHGVGRIALINSLIVLALSFAVFWIQLGYMVGNTYHKQDGHESIVPYRKSPADVQNVYGSWNNLSDQEAGNFMMSRDLEGVFITVLDQLVLYGILLINLYIIQFNWNWGLFFVNLVLAGKDIAVIVAWAWEQQNIEDWTFSSGLWNWGILFLRRPLGLPVTLALLNLFLLRIPYFVLGCSKTDDDIDTEADLYSEAPEEPGFFMKYIGYPLTRFGKFILVAYLFALFCLLIANFFPGLVLVTLGMFGFFTLYFFVFLTVYTIPFINAKYAVRNRWYAKNYYLMIKAKCRLDLIERELKKALHAHRSFRHRENVYEYPKLLFYFVMFTFCVQYGSIWLKGGSFGALMRFLYASPFQFTFNVLTSNNHGDWSYVFRWLSAI